MVNNPHSASLVTRVVSTNINWGNWNFMKETIDLPIVYFIPEFSIKWFYCNRFSRDCQVLCSEFWHQLRLTFSSQPQRWTPILQATLEMMMINTGTLHKIGCIKHNIIKRYRLWSTKKILQRIEPYSQLILLKSTTKSRLNLRMVSFGQSIPLE